jgi:hypothetical protein
MIIPARQYYNSIKLFQITFPEMQGKRLAPDRYRRWFPGGSCVPPFAFLFEVFSVSFLVAALARLYILKPRNSPFLLLTGEGENQGFEGGYSLSLLLDSFQGSRIFSFKVCYALFHGSYPLSADTR